MLRIIAILFGIVLIVIGVGGYFPQFKVGDLLLGYFMVDPIHNIVHIVTGVLAIMAATSEYYTRLFFQVFGIVYALVAILGFLRDGDLFIMHVNMADNILHVVIALVSLFLGFFVKPRRTYY